MTSGVEVRVVAGAREWVLGPNPISVPAGPVVLAVTGARSRNVLLDGRRTRLSTGQTGLVALDLTRSTGYHRIVVDGVTFWFGTEDAKLGLDGVEAMLAHLRTLGTGWTGQALFSDGSGLRDTHVLYAWLDQWADRTLSAVNGILASPRSVTHNTRALSRRGGPAVLLSPTLRLLRSDPRRYLDASPRGLLSVGADRYDPLRVVVRRRATNLDSVANRRAVGLLIWLAKLCKEVIANEPDQPATVRCRLWLNRTQTLQRRPLAQALAPTAAAVTSATRQAEEATEAHYRTSYEVSRDLHRQFGWSANLAPMPRYSYVARADTIYQAYVASCFARALGMVQTASVLGSQPRSFASHQFDLYYDATPPPEVLRSWRATSSRPDSSRPDLLLHERDTGRVALLDAKYRIDRDGGASEDSRKDVTAYLGLYGVDAITIVYPGAGHEVVVIAGQDRRIIEVPAAPQADMTGAVTTILGTLQHPPF